MAEYIEREALLESLPVAWDSAVNAIESAPAADVVPVIRCRDCKHFDPIPEYFKTPDGEELQMGFCRWKELAAGVKADEAYFCVDFDCFCSFARRKDGGDNDG